MKKQILTSNKGLSLVELLLGLSLIGVVSVLIVGVLVGGINSYRSVNKQINLHDEANAIMTKFSNEIFVAVSVEPDSKDPVKEIVVEKYGGEKLLLTFNVVKGEVEIGSKVINSSMVTVSDKSYFTVDQEKGIVKVYLKIEDHNGRSIQLSEEVTYVNVE